METSIKATERDLWMKHLNLGLILRKYNMVPVCQKASRMKIAGKLKSFEAEINGLFLKFKPVPILKYVCSMVSLMMIH